MSLLRILRNLAVLVILTVGGLALRPRPAAAVSRYGNQTGLIRCSCHVIRCRPIGLCGECYGGERVRFYCYDTYYKRYCFWCTACPCQP